MIFVKLQSLLEKLVGPNAAHMIDGFVALGIVDGTVFVASADARVFLLHHATLGLLAQLAVPPAIALASRFRKAAGQSNVDLVAELARVVEEAIAKSAAPSTVTVTVPPPPTS